jgi:hypothetical protein
MTTEIKSWEIVDGRLVPVESRLADHGRTEALDLWNHGSKAILPSFDLGSESSVGRFSPGRVRWISWRLTAQAAS